MKKVTLLFATIVLAFACVVAASAKGKKYAVLVGINDYINYNGLEGAVPDVQHMKAVLESKFQFLPANEKMLTDRDATRANILAALKTMAAKAGSGDLFVFHYSGHGTLWLDRKSQVVDETVKTELHVEFPDGGVVDYPLDFYDSAICPVDSGDFTAGKVWPNLILDDELYDIFSPMAARGVEVVVISDSCHSGSVGKAGAVKGKIRWVDPLKATKMKSFADIKTPKGQTKAPGKQIKSNYIVLGAAQNNEFAMDAAGSNQLGGLFTSTLIDYINSSKTPLTYQRLMDLTKKKVADTSLNSFNNPQHPSLTGIGTAGGTIFSLPK
ncbi:MAG TPA: caspase family protein [Pyrinomonadaceae bacterium]|nr:caspase family protein [Pyrinomonadaceae bacterium]